MSFGRTSLTVPVSCCTETARGQADGEWCGINALPTPVLEKAKNKINMEGCFIKIISSVKFHLQVIGYFSILVSILTMGLVGAVSYLMVTKKM